MPKQETNQVEQKEAITPPKAGIVNPSKFSRKQLALLALAFVLFGIFVIWVTRAGTVPLATVEGEAMTIPTGAYHVTDTAASGTKALRLDQNGTTTAPFSIPSAASSITVRAKGIQCSGAPQMVVKVDGVQVQSNYVSATSWTDYSSPVTLAAGAHTLSISFPNDYAGYTGNKKRRTYCTRDLFIDKSTLFGTSSDSLITVNDSTVGTGTHQFEFVGSWSSNNDAGAYAGDQHYSGAAGAYYQVRFSGTQAKIFTVVDAHHGIAAVSIDGGAETMVDTYSATRAYGVLVYTSPVLADGAHILKVRVTGTKNAAGTGAVVVGDKVEINSSNTPPPPPPPAVRITTPANGATISGSIPVEATASSSSSTIAKVELLVDGILKTADNSAPYCLADPNATPCTNWDSNSVSDGTHTITAYAYDANGVKSLASTVSVTVKNSIVTGCASPAPFPSRLKAVGRNLVDENGCVMPKLKGFNIHTATSTGSTWSWPNSDFAHISSSGGKILRTVVKWDTFEPTQGAVNANNLLALDTLIARAQRNGIYVILELHLNTGNVPSWATNGDDETDKYMNHGQNITQTLARRYSVARAADGITIDPRTVLGFNINEPPQDQTTLHSNNSIPTFESQQRQMISWFRNAGAPNWIGFVTLAYANQKPYVASPKISANPDAYDAVGGNVVFDAHDYLVYNESSDYNTDSRQSNGSLADTRYFHPGARWLSILDPHHYDMNYDARNRAQMKAFLSPFNTYANAAQMPLMVGEFGWNGERTGGTGKSGYYSAKRNAMKCANTAIEILWIYANSKSQDQWSGKDSATTWDPEVLAWLQDQDKTCR